jgi:hypothetical protein
MREKSMAAETGINLSRARKKRRRNEKLLDFLKTPRMFKILVLFLHRHSHHRADMTEYLLFNVSMRQSISAYADARASTICGSPVLLPVM